jgi:hypothetical protein
LDLFGEVSKSMNGRENAGMILIEEEKKMGGGLSGFNFF